MQTHPDQRQRGVILLLLLLVLFVSGSTLMLGALNNRQNTWQQRQGEIRVQMKLAKEALLAYAGSVDANFNVGPGHLPCPDRDNDALPDSSCDPLTQYIGRLPQYVQIDPLNPTGERFYLNNAYAGIDQQFWYAVAPDYVHSDASTLQANSNISGSLQLDGTGDIVAVLVAPGEAFENQDRAATPNAYTEYLENGNGLNNLFWTSYAANPAYFNDQVLTITRQEVIDVATVAAAKAIKTRLDSFRTSCGVYPRSWITGACGLNFGYSAATSFADVMNNAAVPTWARATSALLTGEQNWAGITTYTHNNATGIATIQFAGCGIVFTLRYNNPTDGISKSQPNC